MSGIGKFFIVIAILGSLAAGAGGFLLSQKKKGYADQLTQVETALKDPQGAVKYAGDFKTNPAEPAATIARANKTLATTIGELNTTKESLTQAETNLSDSQAKVVQLTTQVNTAQKELEEKTAALATAQTEAKAASEELAGMKDKLGGRELEAVLAQSRQNEEKLVVMESEKKLIEETLLQKQAQIDEYNKLRRLQLAKAAPMELSGKVVALNKSWNFVVLNVGQQNQLVEGVDLTVYRGDTLIGKVRTVSVDQETAIADILPEWAKSEIQVGDQVLF
ncbi:MAG: hypothetical protein ACFCUX_00790 [Candidatus Methylacidiphilales bacterium]